MWGLSNEAIQIKLHLKANLTFLNGNIELSTKLIKLEARKIKQEVSNIVTYSDHTIIQPHFKAVAENVAGFNNVVSKNIHILERKKEILNGEERKFKWPRAPQRVRGFRSSGHSCGQLQSIQRF